MTLRALGIFERALSLSDQHTPFNVVSVLRLESPPLPEILQNALAVLQIRHPLLQAGIRAGKFERLANPSFSFEAIENQGEINWIVVVEQEMNTRLNPERELFRATYIYNSRHGDLFLTFHHVIMDAAARLYCLFSFRVIFRSPPTYYRPLHIRAKPPKRSFPCGTRTILIT